MEDVVVEEDSLEQVGLELREAREGQELSLAEVAEAIHVNLSSLKALEAGEFNQPPGPVFMRGFLRSYASHVGLDATELLDRVGPLLGEAPSKEKSAPRQQVKIIRVSELPPSSNVWTRVSLVAVVIALALVAYLYLPLEELTQDPESPSAATQEEPQPPAVAEGPPQATPPAAKPPEPEASPLPSTLQEPSPSPAATPEPVSPEPPEAPPAEASPAAVAEAPEPAEAAPPAETAEVVPILPLSLRVEALKHTWIGIRVDELDPVDVQLDPGEVFEWDADQQFSVMVANTQAVLLTFSGQPLPLNTEKPMLQELQLTRDSIPTPALDE